VFCCFATQAVAQAFVQGADRVHEDDQSSTTWYDSAGPGSTSGRSSFRTARADSLSAAEFQDADEYASMHSTGSFVSAAGSFVSASGSFNSHASLTSAQSQQLGG
jgi:hypothetical protein